VNELFYEIGMLQKTSQSLTELSFEIGIHQSRHFILCRKSLKKSVGFFDTESLKVDCEIGLFPGFKCTDIFFGNSYH
jgi:hypothetical protein